MIYPDRTTLGTIRQRTVLRLVCDGVERFYSDAALLLTDATPGSTGTIDVRAGMSEPDLADELGQEGQGASIEILDPGAWSDIVSGLIGAWAELSQVGEGQDWTARRVIVRGYADAPIYGSQEEPILFGLQASPWTDRGLVPLPTWQVGAETWPRSGSGLGLPEDLQGPFYPVILGDPGADADATTEADWYPIPALIVEIDTGLDPADNSANACTVLLGAGPLGCVGDNIELFNETTGATAALVPFATADRMGQQVTCITVAAGDMPVVAGDSLWWRPEAGGLAGIAQTGTAGAAMRFLLSFSSSEVDYDLLRDVADRLDRWKVGGWINEPISPFGWIQDNLLNILPVLSVDGPGGTAFVALPVSPDDAAGLETIDVDEAGGSRAGPVEVSSWRDVSTSLSMEYATDTRTGAYRRRIDLDPTIDTVVGSRQPTPYGAQASLRYAGLRLLDLTTDAICDPGTAAAIAEYQIRGASQLTAEVEVVLPQTYQTLQSGDLIRLTLPDTLLPTGAPWTAVLCVVLSVPRISGMGVFRFRTVPDWSRP